MFNKFFFERDFEKLYNGYLKGKDADTPAVEFVLADGSRHRISTIELLGDEWISFRATPDSGENGETRAPDQITCPYKAIARVNFYPRVHEKRVGFRISRT